MDLVDRSRYTGRRTIDPPQQHSTYGSMPAMNPPNNGRNGPIASAPLSTWSPYLLSVLRMVTAFLFMQHGAQKLLSFPAPPTTPPALFSLLGLAGILELFGGLLLFIGLFTRPVAFVLSGFMAV